MALSVGIAAVPGGAGGFIAGGIIINKWSLTNVQRLRGMFVLGIVGLISTFLFAVQCDAPPLADITSHQLAVQTNS